ncbi:MAG: hypothetical protein C0394_00700 [Syntrophus sp. (in: bacteria)]|nr:hypothetical protein [Syntrophus sp. (in: bacteria)]
MKSEAGFTLIEIIVSLILVGILAAVGGMAIVQVVQGYILTRDNAALTQKAQLAMSRITNEIVEMTGITANADSATLPIRNAIRNVTIGLDAGAIKIAPDGVALGSGDILVDNVNAFTLTYYSGAPGSWVQNTSWSTGSDIRNLIAVDVSMQLLRSGGGYLTFQNRVTPRNNKNQGGTLPTAPPPSAGTYPGCFVATAAYGAADHPMVMLLRDFRDRCLLPWQGGRWLVKQYYAYGPAAADLIRNRPPAMWAVRCLLAPLAALTFFLVYAPLAILLILLSVAMFIVALLSVGRRESMTLTGVRLNQGGSVLIGLIVTMVSMSLLGAAMLPIFSASYMNQVYADQGRKAYFLAESGFRYAASLYLNASTATAKETVLTNLNNKTCNLSGGGGSFTTVIYPYWFRTQSVLGTTLTTQIPGTNPSNTTPARRDLTQGGYLKIGSAYYQYTSGSGSGTTVTFTGLSPALAAAPSPSADVLPVVLPGSTTTVTNGGNLTLSPTGVGAFPVLNGNFTLGGAGTVYSYEKRTGNILYNITLTNPAQVWTNFSVTSGDITQPATTKIVLEKFLQLSSTGAFGNTSREILYNVPIGWMAGGGEFSKQQDYDPGMTGWAAPAGGGGGTHSVQTVDGGSALKVDTAPSSGGLWTGAGNWAMAFFTGYANVSLAKAWLDAQGFLSYDLQVKVYNTQPYYFAGMNFRNRNNSDNTDLYSYGVSFIKPRQTRGCIVVCGSWGAPSDQATALIPGYASDAAAGPLFSNPGLFQNLEQTSQPFIGTQQRYGLPAIVLWKRTSAGFQWLAYRILTTADGIVYAPGSPANALRLTNWSTLMIRVAEGYSLIFSSGGGASGVGVPIKEGDTIETLDKTSSARVVMTPILTGGSWTARSAAGAFVLANIKTGATAIAAGVPLYVNGVQRANAAAGVTATKRNYLRVYYTRPTAQGTANANQTDNNRLANPRNSVNWPPDDLTDLAASNDYVTLVQWTGYNTGVSAFTSTSEPSAIIVDSDLTTPTWTSTSTTADFVFPNGNSGDSISLMTSSGSATSTYYDDFAIQLDQKAGTGFLPPIQQ